MKTKLLNITMTLIVTFFIFGYSANAQHKFKIKPAQSISASHDYHTTSTIANSASRIGNNTAILTTACDTPNLYAYQNTWTLTSYSVTATPQYSLGFVNGVNTYADEAIAAYFPNTSANTYVLGAMMAFDKAYTTTPSKILYVDVYNVFGGNPNTLLASQAIPMSEVMSDVSGNYFVDVNFASPVNVSGAAFFIVIDMTGLNWASSHDTLSMQSNVDPETTPSAAWEKQSSGTWYQYNNSTYSWNLNISLAVFPVMSNVPANASFTQSATNTCAGYPVSLDASTSVESAVSWVLNGGTPSSSNTVTQNVTYATAGTYPIKLYVQGGSCNNIDSMITSITINPAPVPSASATPSSVCQGASSTLNAANGITYQWSGFSLSASPTQTVTPTSSTIYTVTVNGSNGCSASQSVTVTWNANPNPNAHASSSSVCYEGLTMLSSTAGMSSYLWAPGGITTASFVAYPTTNTTYTVSIMNAMGCTATGSVAVTVNPQILTSMTTTDATCGYPNGTATETPSGGTPGYTYMWNSSPSQTTACATGLAQGTYFVTVTDVNGCSVIDTAIVNCITGIISSINNKTGFNIMPNPSNGSFSLLINGYEGKDIVIDIYNAEGALVFSNKMSVTSNAFTNNLFLPAKGVYSVRLLTKETVENHTIVIQ